VTEGIDEGDPASKLEKELDDLASGGVTGLGALVVGKGLGFGFQLLLARVLGPASYGLFSLGRAIENTGETFGELGVGTGIVRFVSEKVSSRDREEAARVFRTALVVATTGSLLTAGGLFLAAPFLEGLFGEPGFARVLRLFSLALPPYTLLTVTTSLAQARRRIGHQQSLLRIWSPLLRIALVGGALALGWGLEGAVVGFAASGFASLALAGYTVYKLFPQLVSSPDWKLRTRELLRFSLPIILTGLASMLALRVDRILLGYLGTASEVGVYNAAAVIGLNLSIAHAAVTNAIKPIFAESHDTATREHFSSVYRAGARWSTAGTFLTILPLLLFPDIVIGFFGAGFGDAVPVLVVLLGWVQVTTINGSTGAALNMSGHQDLELVNSLALLAGIVAFDLILIPRFGALGAALGTLAATTLAEFIRVAEIYSIHGFHPYDGRHLGIVGAIVGIGAVAVQTSRIVALVHRAWILVLLAALSLGVLALLASQSDRRLVRTFLRKLQLL
jgi:O-antigen/teichoic acid export membrane protein